MNRWRSLKGQDLSDYLTNLTKFVKKAYPPLAPGTKLSEGEIAARIGVDASRLSKLKQYLKHAEITEGNCIDAIQRIMEVFQVRETADVWDFRPVEEWTSLKRLGEKLALNLVDVSTVFEEGDRPHHLIMSSDVQQIRSNPVRERFIVIVGAGASRGATHGNMPLTKEAAKDILARISREEDELLVNLIEEELERLRLIYKLNSEDFETVLKACSKYCRDTVLEGLKELCGVRYVPALAYEILAHMFKHRVIDIIINFNHDEILDNAIEEEISEGEYFNIYSDGYCPDKYRDFLIGNRLKQPVYFKPHGTISHQSTLRFTREDYFTIPTKIRETIYDLLKAPIDQTRNQKSLPINLAFIGFSMQSFEFTELIKKFLTKFPERRVFFWFFDKKVKLEDFHLELSPDLKKKIKENSYFFDLNWESFETILKCLWTNIENNFNEPYKPRGIERHLLVDLLLKGYQEKLLQYPRQVNDRDLCNYFRNRFFVELIISFLQSDGILNSRQIVEDRAGKYFELYLRLLEHVGEEISLRKICQDFGFRIYKDFVWDAFTLKKPDLFFDHSNLYHELYTALARNFREHAIPENDAENKVKETFYDLADRIRRRNLMKITPDYRHPHKHLFEGLRKKDILNTKVSWVYRYRYFLETQKANWDLLLAISEKGRFLNFDLQKEDNLFADRKLELVLASFDWEEFKDRQRFDSKNVHLLSGRPLYLPWWLHNQHMVLFLKKDRDTGDWRKDWNLKEGFYYESRVLSRRINPVHVKSNHNLEILLFIYANYWYRAKEYTDKNPIPSLPNRGAMEEQIEDLLGLF